MRIADRTSSRVLHQTSLASCLAAAFSLATPLAMATNHVVGNCNDSGPGSLRTTAAFPNAVDGDTVDLSQLMCSTITLTTGAIDVVVNNLTLTAGNGAVNAVTIDGGFSTGHHNRVLNHTGIGTLTVKGLIVTDAKYNSGPHFYGGCIYSKGNIRLVGSTVSHCTVIGSSAGKYVVAGGGVAALGNVYLLASTVTANTAQATNATPAQGGGISAVGDVSLVGSTVTRNVAQAASSQASGGGIDSNNGKVTALHSIIANNSAASGSGPASGGGISTNSGLNISYSTISGNQADFSGGIESGSLGSSTAVISNSTVSGNRSTAGNGGGRVLVPLTLSNSTVAFNTTNCSGCVGGLRVYDIAQLQSSIIANNTAAGVASDFRANVTATGANNLIFNSASIVPRDTLVGVCPKLQPADDNGGSILTDALLHTSPAIDMGNNAMAFTYDERGQFPYSRVFGARADIGAYEWQGGPDNRIFHSGFEPGCDE